MSLLEQARAKIERQIEVEKAATSDEVAVAQALHRLGEPSALAQWLRSHAPAADLETGSEGRLSACRSCWKEVSVEAVTCPHCDAPQPAYQRRVGCGYEWKSKQSLCGWPLVHVACGRDEHNRLRVAKGIVAVGQFAQGGIAIGQFSAGTVFGLGQFVAAPIAIGQVALGLLVGLGQISTGTLAIGQFAFGGWVRAMGGSGTQLSSATEHAPEAAESC
jgi:hypothetical protein